jgi:hypothetical protein
MKEYHTHIRFIILNGAPYKFMSSIALVKLNIEHSPRYYKLLGSWAGRLEGYIQISEIFRS